MRNNACVWLFIVLIGIVSCFTVSASTPQLSSNFMIVNGSCNYVVNQQNDHGAGSPLSLESLKPCTAQKGNPPSKNFNDAVINIERYLEYSHPTELKLSGVTIQNWLGDGEEYLTLNIGNESTLPAVDVSIQVLVPTASGDSPAKPQRFTPSHAFPPALTKHLAIPANQSTNIAVAPISELAAALSSPPPAGYQLVGVGLSPNMPDALTQQLKEQNGIRSSGIVEFVAKPIAVDLRFKTIFGGKNGLLTGIYLYYGKGTVLPDIDATKQR